MRRSKNWSWVQIGVTACGVGLVIALRHWLELPVWAYFTVGGAFIALGWWIRDYGEKSEGK